MKPVFGPRFELRNFKDKTELVQWTVNFGTELALFLWLKDVGRSRDRFPVVSLGIFSEVTDGTMCPGVDSASKYEYQENSWE
jgi:hypothetical protein